MIKRSLTALSLIFIISCQSSPKNEPPASSQPTSGGLTVIKYDYKSGEIEKICSSQMKHSDERLSQLVKISSHDKNFENTIAALDQIMADLSDETSGPVFMYSVSTSKSLRKEAEKCDSELSQYFVGVMSRKDLYDSIVQAEKNSKKQKLKPEDKRLIEQVIKGFKENGVDLPDDKLAQVRTLKQKLATLETQFAANLNENTDYEEMGPSDIDGIPETVLARFQKLSGGKYKVTTKPTDYVQFMENAKNADARKRLQIKYENRAANKNTQLLTEAIELRRQIAGLLGFKSWADYRTANRMAGSASKVSSFLKSLKGKLAQRNKKDLAKLLAFKKSVEPGAKVVNPWDGTYLAYQLKKRDYTLDDEMIREYFPADQTVSAMFEVYSQILGVKFVEVKGADVWAPHVKLYEVRNKKDDSFVAHFFTDFVPREGKYGHAAAFTLRQGRIVNGKYQFPISSIVANFTAPSGDKPSMFSHNEVETLFHEFGHIMHQTLTQAKYATLSGSSVARDFVEAPSQMLENWVWDPSILKRLSGHYKDASKKLPDSLIKKMIAARDFNQGYFYTRQLLFGLFDYSLHTASGSLDPTALYKKLYKELTTIDPLEETHFPAGFGHLMGGYDAGYYGYLWSEVFAQDMFTRFESEGLLNAQVGMEYRKAILERGDSEPAGKLLAKFLGRAPNNQAFFKRLGIQ
ncbi:MAG: Zn-dependent oligopeptidase [Oligoflexia bacterium]|nr:Zn-dependent oligopeptidase [Oligoflexia bacterium]